MTGAKGEHFKVQKIAFEICSNIFLPSENKLRKQLEDAY